MKNLLTIAGSDSSGGAGIQADIKTFSANGCYAMSVITSITAQNTVTVSGIEDISPEMIKAQLDAVFSDIKVDGVKIGMVSKTESILAIADRLEYYKPTLVVLDPVMVSTTKKRLLSEDAIDTLKKKLIPLSYIITPNIAEAEVLADMEINNYDDVYKSCEKIFELGSEYVLVKGGHSVDGKCNDILFDGKEFFTFEGERINSKNTHGTGCTLSSAIAANLAKGENIKDAIAKAKEYVTLAIKHSLNIGHGSGPTNHFFNLEDKA